MPKLSVIEGYINTALNGITGIKKVETDVGRFQQANIYPVLYYSVNRTGSDYISYPHATNNDMEGVAELRVFGSIKPKYKANIKTDTYSLIADVETALQSSTNLQNSVVSLLVKTEENDMDINDSFGYFEMTVEIIYLYNHTQP